MCPIDSPANAGGSGRTCASTAWVTGSPRGLARFGPALRILGKARPAAQGSRLFERRQLGSVRPLAAAAGCVDAAGPDHRQFFRCVGAAAWEGRLAPGQFGGLAAMRNCGSITRCTGAHSPGWNPRGCRTRMTPDGRLSLPINGHVLNSRLRSLSSLRMSRRN